MTCDHCQHPVDVEEGIANDHMHEECFDAWINEFLSKGELA